MKKSIELHIKAADFKLGGYFDSESCPITKALERSGLKGYEDCGVEIIHSESQHTVTDISNEDYRLLSNKVIRMFSYLDGIVYTVEEGPSTPIPVEDFTHVLVLDV